MNPETLKENIARNDLTAAERSTTLKEAKPETASEELHARVAKLESAASTTKSEPATLTLEPLNDAAKANEAEADSGAGQ